MAKSDLDEVMNSPSEFAKWKMTRSSEENSDDNDKQIHSGHFMVSSLVDNEGDEEDENNIKNVVEEKATPKGYDFSKAQSYTTPSYMFGNRQSSTQLAIDASLTKLFECMTLAYSGKLTSPKWKNFKGIKVPLKDKIRLNNIIWREWHMQYIQGKNPLICQFEPPISEKIHIKAEAVVLEGKYWKRRLESVTAEYKKWRQFWRDRSRKESRDDSFIEMALHMDHFEGHRQNATSRLNTPQLTPPLDHRFMTDEDFYMDITDTLFSSLTQNQPFCFPNPREFSQLGNADIIQPGLVQLQPTLDEFMDTLEPLPSLNEMMSMSSRSAISPLLSVPCTMPRQFNLSSIQTMDSLGYDDSNLTLQTLADSSPEASNDRPQLINLAELQSLQNASLIKQQHQGNYKQERQNNLLQQFLVDNSSFTCGASDGSFVSDLNAKNSFSNISPQIFNVVTLDSLQKRSQMIQNNQTHQQQNTYNVQLPPNPTVQQLLNHQQHQLNQHKMAQQDSKTVTIIQNTSLQALLQGLTQQQNSNVDSSVKHGSVKFDLGASSSDIPTSLTLFNPPITAVSQAKSRPSKTHSEGTIQSILRGSNKQKFEADHRRRSAGSMPMKKDGNFLVPNTPVTPKTRHRNLAPAPPSGLTSSTNSTVLTHLLTQSPSLPIKQEKTDIQMHMSAFQPIKPAPVSNTISSHTGTSLSDFTVSNASISDFQRSMLLAAVSQAMGTGTVALTDSLPTQPNTSFSNPSGPAFNIVGSQFLISNCSSPSSDLGTRSRHASNDSTGSATYRDDTRSRHASNDSTGSATYRDDYEFTQPMKPFRPKNESERVQYKQMRRESHINAEQKRRGNIKVGFELLQEIVPSLRQYTSNRVSKAICLSKAAEYCRKLKQERTQMQEEAEILKQEIESLNNSISLCQSQLPATGVPVTRQRSDQMREKFGSYVRIRTQQNWKFWIFSIIIQSLLDSYNKSVSTSSGDELCRTVLAWLEQHCSLVALRQTVPTALRQFCTTTSMLTDPAAVPHQISEAVKNSEDLSGCQLPVGSYHHQ